MTKDRNQAAKLVDIATRTMHDKLAKDITVIDFDSVRGSLFEFYVICTANSPSHADTLAEEIRKDIFSSLKLKPHREEGLQNCQWVLLDYFDVIIHVFLKEQREFYNIESIWKDVKHYTIEL